MPNIWERIEDKLVGHHDDEGRDAGTRTPVEDASGARDRAQGGVDMVDGVPRTQGGQDGTAPADVADENEVNVGGAPRTEAHARGHAPAMVASEGEVNVGGAPRSVDDSVVDRSEETTPSEDEDLRRRPQA